MALHRDDSYLDQPAAETAEVLVVYRLNTLNLELGCATVCILYGEIWQLPLHLPHLRPRGAS